MRLNSFLTLLTIGILTTGVTLAQPMRPAPDAELPDVLVIDDFEDGEARENPHWWRFGNLNAAIAQNFEETVPFVESRSIQLTGKSSDWVVGGIGTYLGIDATKYNAIKLVVKGKGEDSGRILIEIYDDDDGNYKVTPHKKYDHYIVGDDKFVYTMPVTWEGWRVVILTLDKFVDDNPEEGDNKWNPFKQKNGGGGFTQIQFIGISTKPESDITIDIDTVKMFHYSGPKIEDEQRDDARYFL